MPQSEPGRQISTRSAVVFWLVGVLIVALVLAAWQALPAILLAFAAAIFAILVLAVARPFERFLGLPRPFALPLAGLVLLALPVVAVLLIGPELAGQFRQLGKAIPDAIEAIERYFDVRLETIVKEATSGGGTGAGLRVPDALDFARGLLSNLGTAGSFVLNGVAGLIIVIAGGFFLAADPVRYRQGIVLLFPVPRQPQVDEALRNSGLAIERWLAAQLVSMVLVGALMGTGAWLIGLPAPLAIAVVTGILEFFPIIGPWLGAVPVLLLASPAGVQTMIAAAVLLLVVQQVESNLITPLAQHRMADIPPFLVLFGLLVFGLLFGLIGVIVAGPLTLVAYVLVMELYVRDALGQDIELPTEKSD